MLSFYLSLLDDEKQQSKFQALYEKHHDILVKSATGRLQDPHRAEDLVHDVFVRIVNHMSVIVTWDDDDIKRYLETAVTNIISDEYRRKHRILFISLDDERNEIADGDKNKSEAHIVERMHMEQVLERLHKMDPAFADVLRLKYMLGLDTKHMAQTLNISEGAVKMRLKRARAQLGMMIEEDER